MKISIQRKSLFKVLGLIGLCALSFGAGFWMNGWTKSSQEKLIGEVYRAASRDSLFNQQPDRELAYAAVRGMLGLIEDPYAELIEPGAAANFTNTFAGQTGVVGLYAENRNGQVVIAIVFPNGSAEKAGVRVGDVILEIDDVVLDSAADSSETGLMLRGLPDTTVDLKVSREGEVLQFELVRKVREYVSYRMLPEGVGYISLTAYNRTATQQMSAALEKILAEDPAGIVWDLRNNEGGDMQAAQDILSFFINDGLLFSAELTNNRTVKFNSKGKSIAADIPLVVLIDQTSYSAAETCAAAIAERGRGKLIGSNSYGKGVIQATIPLQDGALLQMTIAKWQSPSGEWYHERGVPPQIEASDDPTTESDELLQAGVDHLLSK
jgi:carboxyl-terminal processing protease